MNEPGVSSLGSIADLRCDVSTGGFRDVSPTGTCAPPRTASRAASATATPMHLCARSTDPIQFVEAHKHITRLRSIRRSENARRMELIDDPGRAAVAHLQPALQQRRRPLLVLHDDLGGLAEQLVAVADV